MFCPHCGTENNLADARFCRSCGEDLKVVSQAMGGALSLPRYVAGRLDQFFLSQRKRDALEGSLSMVTGFLLFVFSLSNIITGEFGSRIMWGLFLFLSSMLVGVGLRDIWIFKRGLSAITKEPGRLPGDLSIYKTRLPPTTSTPAPLPAANATGEVIAAPPQPSSVTDNTTRLFDDAEAERATEKL
jgi:hypothetical protein